MVQLLQRDHGCFTDLQGAAVVVVFGRDVERREHRLVSERIDHARRKVLIGSKDAGARTEPSTIWAAILRHRREVSRRAHLIHPSKATLSDDRLNDVAEDAAMPFTQTVLPCGRCWCDHSRRFEAFQHLAVLALEFTSLIVSQRAWYSCPGDPVQLERCHDGRCGFVVQQNHQAESRRDIQDVQERVGHLVRVIQELEVNGDSLVEPRRF